MDDSPFSDFCYLSHRSGFWLVFTFDPLKYLNRQQKVFIPTAQRLHNPLLTLFLRRPCDLCTDLDR